MSLRYIAAKTRLDEFNARATRWWELMVNTKKVSQKRALEVHRVERRLAAKAKRESLRAASAPVAARRLTATGRFG